MSLAMSIEEREQFLSDLHVGLISIPRSARGPLTVPIWYDYEPGGAPWMITELNSLKGRYLQKCDRISLCVQNESLPYKYVFSMCSKRIFALQVRYRRGPVRVS